MPLDRTDIIQLSIFLMTRPSKLGRAAAAPQSGAPQSDLSCPLGTTHLQEPPSIEVSATEYEILRRCTRKGTPHP